jgi:phosphoglycerate dehydrogenase-like enzyme
MSFAVGLSADLSNNRGGFSWGDIAIETLNPLTWNFLADPGKNFTPESVAGYHGIGFAGPGVIPGSFGSPAESPLIIARFGVGYDNIDLAECTRAGVALTITPDGSKKPVATAALTLMLATMHRLAAKENLAHTNNWGARLSNGLGSGLNGKTVGTIGFGNIGTEFFRLIEPFECTRLSFDPWKTQADADPHQVTLISLDKLLQRCDVIVVLATLTPETRHMINEAKLALMKSTAYLINVSRGPIVDESALIKALQAGKIAGAGLDVFESEPPAADNPLLAMENVVVTPHNIAWTDELALGMGKSALSSIKTISEGKIPQFVVNRDVLETPQFLSKLESFCG